MDDIVIEDLKAFIRQEIVAVVKELLPKLIKARPPKPAAQKRISSVTRDSKSTMAGKSVFSSIFCIRKLNCPQS